MKIKTIVLAFILLLASVAFAGENPVRVTLTNGSTFDWKHYNDTDDSYCTYKGGGQFCIQKKDVQSIVEIKDDTPKDAHVIYSCTKNCGQSFKPSAETARQNSMDRWKPEKRNPAQQAQQANQPQAGLKGCASNNDCGPHMICQSKLFIGGSRGMGSAKICVQANKWDDKDWWAR